MCREPRSARIASALIHGAGLQAREALFVVVVVVVVKVQMLYQCEIFLCGNQANGKKKCKVQSGCNLLKQNN